MKNKINILIFSGLLNNSLNRHLIPLLNIKKINKIILIRDTKGIKSKKINYITTKFRNSILKIIDKTVKGYLYLIKHDVEYIHSFFLFTHGIRALILAKIFKDFA